MSRTITISDQTYDTIVNQLKETQAALKSFFEEEGIMQTDFPKEVLELAAVQIALQEL